MTTYTDVWTGPMGHCSTLSIKFQSNVPKPISRTNRGNIADLVNRDGVEFTHVYDDYA